MPRTAIEISDESRVTTPIKLLWAILCAVVVGAFMAGIIWQRVEQMSRKIDRFESLEQRVLRIETRIGISSLPENRSTVILSHNDQ